MKRAVHVRADLPVVAHAAKLDRLDVQELLVGFVRRLAIEKEARYPSRSYCRCHIAPLPHDGSWYARVRKVQVSGGSGQRPASFQAGAHELTLRQGSFANESGLHWPWHAGQVLAINLAAAGHDLMVYDTRAEPLRELAAAGAKIARSNADVARHAEVVQVCVLDDAQVETVMAGPSGLFETAAPARSS